MTEQQSTQMSEHFQGMSIDELAEVLFCSSLQPSQPVSEAAIAAAVAESLHSHRGEIRECAGELAQSYGKEPEVACLRMRWARSLVAQAYPGARLAS